MKSKRILLALAVIGFILFPDLLFFITNTIRAWPKSEYNCHDLPNLNELTSVQREKLIGVDFCFNGTVENVWRVSPPLLFSKTYTVLIDTGWGFVEVRTTNEKVAKLNKGDLVHVKATYYWSTGLSGAFAFNYGTIEKI